MSIADYIGDCRGCPAKVIWCRTTAGELQPVNVEPDPRGNLILTVEGAGAPRSEVVDLFNAAKTSVRYMPHHATCPGADQFRKGRRRR